MTCWYAGPPGATTFRATSSASMRRAPCATRRSATADLPAPMPPVSPTTSMHRRCYRHVPRSRSRYPFAALAHDGHRDHHGPGHSHVDVPLAGPTSAGLAAQPARHGGGGRPRRHQLRAVALHAVGVGVRRHQGVPLSRSGPADPERGVDVGPRLWMGPLFFAAGTGVWALGRMLGLSRTGRLAAALAYMLSPYVLSYIDRISAILMPWAGAGWMLVFAI